MRPTRAVEIGLALMLLIGGCAAAGGIRHNPDGTLSIQCSGGYHDWSLCHARASDACAAGFDILSRVSNEGSTGVGVRDWSVAGSEVSRTLVVRCRP